MKNMITIVYLFAFLAIVNGDFRTCSPGLATPGITVPNGDITLEYGDSLNIYCILNPDHEDYKKHRYNSSHMYFTHQNDRVDQKNIIVVNDTTIQLHIPRPAKSESLYYCKLDSRENDVVCLNYVTVGTKPTEVDNFECVSLNWSNLTCTWKPQHNFVKTHFYLSFGLPRRNGRMQNMQCPNMTMETDTGQYYCFWSLNTDPSYRQSYATYYFNLTATNKFGSQHQEFIFNHYAHLKPDSPMNLTVDLRTPHSCQLHWSLPDPMFNFPGKIVHKIIYHTDLDNAWYTVNTSSLPTIGTHRHFAFNLTNLPYAYRPYNIRVAIRTEQDIDEKFWSNNATITCRTLGKPPERSPLVDIGSFEVVANLSHRNVTLYWEQLQVYEENGDNFTYKVEVQSDGMKLNHLTKHSVKGYIVFESLPLSSLQFMVSSSNVEGNSPNKSKLILSPQNEVMHEPTSFVKIALGNGSYELTWKPPKIRNVSLLHSYTIFWCENSRDRPYQCEGRLQWQRIPPDAMLKNYTMPEDKIYQFAISANGYETSSGMVWASCTIIPNKAVGKIKDIWFVDTGATSITIKWKLECPDNVGVIIGYKISYCPIYGLSNGTCRGDVETVKTNITDNVGLLNNLKPYTTYAIQVAIIAKHEVGPLSDPIHLTTSETSPDPPVNVSIQYKLSPTNMSVLWEPPLNINGVLRYFKVFYKPLLSLIWQEEQVEKDASHQVNLVNLSSYTEYDVYVTACTVSCSEPSQLLRVRTAIGFPGKVGRPSIINGVNNHLITWKPPLFNGGTLDMYVVRRYILKQRLNITDDFNTSLTSINIPSKYCEEDDIQGYVYIVRAINVATGPYHGAEAITLKERVHIHPLPSNTPNSVYPGEWSEYAELKCSSRPSSNDAAYWIIGVISFVFIVIIALCLKKVWIVIDKMRSIKPIMPEGLYPESDGNSKYQSPKDWTAIVPKDESSTLLAKPQVPASPVDPPITIPGSGLGSRRNNSMSSSRLMSSDESDAELPANTVSPTSSYVPLSAPIVTNSTPPVVPMCNGYVQAAMLPPAPSTNKESLPPTYVLTAPGPSSPNTHYVRTATLPDTLTPTPTPPVAVVSPYVTVATLPQHNTNKDSGYIAHNHPILNNNPKSELAAKRISAPPLVSSKLSDDQNKRISLTNCVLPRSDMPDSPDYCRFGWNSVDETEIGQDGNLGGKESPSLDLNSSSNDCEFQLRVLTSDKTDTLSVTPSQATKSHYLPHTLKSQ